MAKIIHRRQYGDKLKRVPSSANSVGRHIEDTEDLKKQVLEQTTWCGKLAIQFGESTDVSNMAQLNVFAKFWFSSEIY